MRRQHAVTLLSLELNYRIIQSTVRIEPLLSRQQSQIRSDAIVDRADGDIRTTDGGCGIPIHTHCAVPEQCKACARHDILKAWKEQRRCSRIYYPCISRASALGRDTRAFQSVYASAAARAIIPQDCSKPVKIRL